MVKGLQILVRNLPRPTYIRPLVKKVKPIRWSTVSKIDHATGDQLLKW
ncbi:unnamed protein product [Brassica oleracea]